MLHLIIINYLMSHVLELFKNLKIKKKGMSKVLKL